MADVPRPQSVQITRDTRKDGSVTFGLRVRASGADERVALGNSGDGWDEVRVEAARKQLLAKIELGLWAPPTKDTASRAKDEEPTVRELATDWLTARKLNPAITNTTTDKNESLLKRYLLPFFGELHPSEITTGTIKEYREQVHRENAQIREAAANGKPLRDARLRRPLRTLGNDSINMTLQMLAQILDDAEDAGWVDRNVARGRRVREPSERRRNRGALDVDEFLALVEAADQLDDRHWPRTIERANTVRLLRDLSRLPWKTIARRVGVAPTTAIYLYGCHENADGPTYGPRRAIIATLGLAGPRVGELCGLDRQDINLARSRFQIRASKTEAGVRGVDIHPRLHDELTGYFAGRPTLPMAAPAFPTRTGGRRDRSNILKRVVAPALEHANEIRASRDDPPILTHLTPHTFRRTYITFLIAAGYDLPYVQAQVGHEDPTTTLAIYAQILRRADRDQLRAEIRALLGVDNAAATPTTRPLAEAQIKPASERLRAAEKAGKGRAPHL